MEFKDVNRSLHREAVIVKPSSEEGTFSRGGVDSRACVVVGRIAIIEALPPSVVHQVEATQSLDPLTEFIEQTSPGSFKVLNGATASVQDRESGLWGMIFDGVTLVETPPPTHVLLSCGYIPQ